MIKKRMSVWKPLLMFCDQAEQLERKGSWGGVCSRIRSWSGESCYYRHNFKESNRRNCKLKIESHGHQGFTTALKQTTKPSPPGKNVSGARPRCIWSGRGPPDHRTCWTPNTVGSTGWRLSGILLFTLCKGEVCLWFSPVGWVLASCFRCVWLRILFCI